MRRWFGQRGYGLRFGWGAEGAAELADPAGALVVVDVLSFTTSVSVVVERGGAVLPFRWRDARAAAHASRHDAALAVGRREVDASHPWSLSPAALREAPAIPRLVLPSPNGSTIAATAGGGTVYAGCLRNAATVAERLRTKGFGTPERPVAVVAAGELRSGGALRPCLEDQLGAAAVLSGLIAAGLPASPEAETAAVRWRPDRAADLVRRSGSGVELIEQGYGGDVEIAVEVDASRTVPVLTAEGFVADR
ncbi:2-phosphosulfolactate phosphatase [Stackebrandtia albiflava]|uniref:Probable 2-phosphosulfolactate phosphatase n=1 Tax=Stackebrandtia albiflava TaxID=406432 RepID=A0A562VBM2_9ACTN|nr:2-phosphosulfolactate phosphatase [Stackebrandtia albiflava]TWJ15252.1 2-phosphosulfolactate phosphatase [Stackebrandtia albiflava]